MKSSKLKLFTDKFPGGGCIIKSTLDSIYIDVAAFLKNQPKNVSNKKLTLKPKDESRDRSKDRAFHITRLKGYFQVSKADLAAWSNTVGHQYIGTVEEGDVLYHYIRKCSNDEIVEKTYEPTITHEEIQTRNGLILDVREEAEYVFGHIEGAKSIPMGELEIRLGELDQTQEIYIICRTGKRSDMAAQLLTKNDFRKVYNVLPGMTEWNGNVIKNVNGGM